MKALWMVFTAQVNTMMLPLPKSIFMGIHSLNLPLLCVLDPNTEDQEHRFKIISPSLKAVLMEGKKLMILLYLNASCMHNRLKRECEAQRVFLCCWRFGANELLGFICVFHACGFLS